MSAEYTTDTMTRERSHLDINTPWNFGVSYQLNDYVNLSTQYLYGSQFSITTNVTFNPGRPPMSGGKELAPVPMRLRGGNTIPVRQSNEELYKKGI